MTGILLFPDSPKWSIMARFYEMEQCVQKITSSHWEMMKFEGWLAGLFIISHFPSLD